MKRGALLAVVFASLVFGLIGCGQQTKSHTQAVEEYYASVYPHLTDWETALDASNGRSRATIDLSLTQMQHLRDDIALLKFSTDSDVQRVRDLLIKYMDLTIDANVSFMAGESDSLTSSKMNAADAAQQEFPTALDESTKGAIGNY